MDSPRTAAFVGTVGGAGTTRACLETGARLAAADRDTLVLDLDFDTQGLARHVRGDIDGDTTALLTDSDIALADARHDRALDAPGRLALAPAHAPFGRVAAAKTADAAQRLDTVLDAALADFDHVLLDTPTVASNPAVAAVTDADRVALVFPGTPRGTDATARERGRLADVGASAHALVATRTTLEAAPPDADRAVPDLAGEPVGVAATPGTSAARAAGLLAETLFDLELDHEEPAGRFDALRRRLP
ncbi:ParA family protein [Salarchaeum sp. JOR-1]|uniref:ParA family protein n=1 Tax=Salarchaeum sp. JOR-1 TaxID=2599399 RepID=UPI0011986B3D|nr:ParA family protein [Salarchaeum sp. JOR-1]QDX40337.1 ParA family protein [Salarchaeum sp. JOR-1]